jgi:thymidylate synthase (FAD)
MKIIPQAAYYLDTTGMSQYQIIEKAGRTCYKSEDKITEESATKFVAALVRRCHLAMLEFGYLYMKITDIDFLEFFQATKPHFIHMVGEYAVGNFRAFYDWYKAWLDGKWMIDMDYYDGFMDLIWCLAQKYPEVYKDLYDKLHEKFEPDVIDIERMNVDDVKYPFMFFTKEELIADYKASGNFDSYLVDIIPHIVMFTTNRGVTHELVRHRNDETFAMESTRYCKYDVEKFGGELTIIEPMQEIRDNPDAYERWLKDTKADEESYMWFVKHGISAQAARGRLPHDIKADIWNACFESQWQHKLNLRMHGTTGAPHPQFKELMELVYPDLVKYSEGRLK